MKTVNRVSRHREAIESKHLCFQPSVTKELRDAAQRTGISVFILVLLLVMGVGELVYAEGIKVGEEVVLMADGPGRTMRSFPTVAFGPTSSKDSVAAGKGIFLAAWQEGWQGEGGSSRIYAARVDLNGKVLDPKGIELAPCKTGIQEYPQVAFFNGVFLVVWNDMRNGRDCDVLGVRVSAEGKVLDNKPISIAAGPRSQAMPNVAADNKGFMVVWHGFADKNDLPQVFTARVGTDGAVNAPVCLITAFSSSPLIAWNGKEHLVLYAKLHGQKALMTKWLRMDTTGKILSKSGNDSKKLFPYAVNFSICGVSGDKGWLMAYDAARPNWWNRGVATQRIAMITPDGKREAHGKAKDIVGRYGPTDGKVPPNWLDTSFGKGGQRNVGGSAHTPKIFPYGLNAVAADGKYCIAVWQRFHMGGATGMEMINGDILASRADGFSALDKGGVAVAASTDEELNPALAGNGAGKLLCVYEKVVNGKSLICAKILQTK
jgi:hypothetical protein